MFRVRRARPYRRYRPVPALVVLTLLGLASGYIWISVLTEDTNIDEAVRCEPHASELTDAELESVGHDALDHVTPLPPDKISVQVLNAGSVRGRAMLTTDTLHKLGFTRTEQPDNDAVYADESANCRGQLRYGGNGERAARTLSLLVPCFELVRDHRQDASVDFVIGSGFGDILPRPEAHTALERLAEFSAHQAGTGDSELSTGQAEPDIDEELLREARASEC